MESVVIARHSTFNKCRGADGDLNWLHCTRLQLLTLIQILFCEYCFLSPEPPMGQDAFPLNFQPDSEKAKSITVC